jgi:hypothetical protein
MISQRAHSPDAPAWLVTQLASSGTGGDGTSVGDLPRRCACLLYSTAGMTVDALSSHASSGAEASRSLATAPGKPRG